MLEHIGERSGLAVVVDGVPVTLELSAPASATGTRLGSVFDEPRRTDVLDQVTKLNGESGKEEHLPDAFDHLADAFLRDRSSSTFPLAPASITRS